MNRIFQKTILLFCLSIISLPLFSQKTNIQIKHEFVNASLQEVLQWIEDHHPVNIAYSEEAISGIRINDYFDHLSLEAFLEKILENTSLTYRLLREDRILIGPIEELSLSSSPKDEQTRLIHGKVFAPNGQPLVAANLYHEESQTGTYTNEEGLFEWPEKLTGDSILIEVSYLGFEKKLVAVSDPAQVLAIELTPSPQFFQEIEVVELLPAPAIDTQLVWSNDHRSSFSPASYLPGGQNILIDYAPGIAIVGQEHQAARLNIRGGNTDENLIVLDGMTLYNVDHFYGFFSALHPGIVNQVRVHKNTFPIEYNGRSSSIIELNPASDAMLNSGKSSLGVDLISANGLLNIPLSKNMSFKAAGRLTHQDIANTPFFQLATPDPPESKINIPEENKRASVINISPEFRFNDLYLTWQWTPDKDHFISASVFSGLDQYEYQYRESYILPSTVGRQIITEQGTERMDWRNTAYGLQFRKNWSARFQSSLNAHYSTYQTEREEGFTVIQTFREQDRVRAAPRSNKLNDIQGIRLSQKNQWQLSDQSRLDFGYTYLQENTGFGIDNSNGLESRNITKENEAFTQSIFLQHTWRPVKALELQTGLNVQRYNLLDGWFGSPRVQARISASDQLSFKASWSIYQQFLRQLYHEDVFGKNQAFWVLAGSKGILPNRTMPHISAQNWMLGMSIAPKGWYFDIEFYQKNRTGIVEYTLRRPGFNQDGVITEPIFGFFQGGGKTQGMDVLLEKRGKHYNSWIAYTLSKSTHQLQGVNFNRPYPAPGDSRHQLRWVNQFKLKERWLFSFNTVFATGLPYLDYSQIREIPPNRRQVPYDRFIKRYKSYYRMDLSVNYSTQLVGLDTQLGFSIFNLWNRKNVKYQQFVFSLEENEENPVQGTELELLPRIWNVSLEVKF